jgi:hypothetical protein
LKQNYKTEVTYNETPLYGRVWLCHFNLIFSSFNPVESALGVEDTWRILATSFDVM